MVGITITNKNRTLGTTPSKATGENLDLAYALAAATAFTKSLIPHLPPSSPTFRFVYCSGIFVERDQQKNLWFLQEARRNRVIFLPPLSTQISPHPR